MSNRYVAGFYKDGKGRTRPITRPVSRRRGKVPAFLIDENLPIRLEDELRKRGYRATHVTRIFRRGISDRAIKEHAEKKNMIVLTRDTVSFPEPKGRGDRVIVLDRRGVNSVDEVLDRIRSLGW
jgi:hypothetical protein